MTSTAHAHPGGRVALRGADALAYDEDDDRWELIGPADGAPRVPAALRRGLSVCLLAPDGAGKSTLVAGLAAALPVRVHTVHMELYGRGERRRKLGLGFAARVARQYRRWTAARLHRARGALVLFDRYPYDALLDLGRPMRRRDRLRRTVLGHLLPPPHLALVLDVPADVLYGRKQERTVEELEHLRAQYRALAAQLPCRTEVIDASAPADAVRREVTRRIWAALTEHDRRGHIRA